MFIHIHCHAVYNYMFILYKIMFICIDESIYLSIILFIFYYYYCLFVI